MTSATPLPLERLRHHVTGAIERGEASPVVEIAPAKRYNVFNRTWWKRVAGRRVPGAGRKTMMARNVSFEIAREIAREYNATHAPGELSRKAELEEV